MLLGDNSPPASGHVPCRTHRHRLSVQRCWGTTDHRRPDTSPAEHTDTDCQYSAAGGQQPTGVRTRALLNTQTQTVSTALLGDNSPPASGHVPCRTHKHRLSVQCCWGTTAHRRPDTSPAEHTDTGCQYSAAGRQQTTGVRTRPLLNTQTQTVSTALLGDNSPPASGHVPC